MHRVTGGGRAGGLRLRVIWNMGSACTKAVHSISLIIVVEIGHPLPLPLVLTQKEEIASQVCSEMDTHIIWAKVIIIRGLTHMSRMQQPPNNKKE